MTENTEIVDSEINLDELLNSGSVIIPDEKKLNVLSVKSDAITNEDLIDNGDVVKEEETLEEIINNDKPIEVEKPKVSTNSNITKTLIEKNLILPFDDDKAIDDYTEEELVELFEENINSIKDTNRKELEVQFFDSLPEEMQYAATYLANGGKDLKSLFKVLGAAEEVKDLNPKVEADQEVIIRNYLQATKFGTNEEIQEEIDEWKDRGDLEAKANKFKPKLDDLQKEIIAHKLQEQETLQKKQIAQTKVYTNNIYETVVKADKINGLDIDMKTKEFLFTGLVNPSFTSVRGNQTNLLGHLLEKYQFVEPNHALIAEALWLLADPEGYKTKVKSNVEKQIIEKTVKQLKTEEHRKTSITDNDEKEEIRRNIAKPRPGFLKRNV